jgi:hypothetical protein
MSYDGDRYNCVASVSRGSSNKHRQRDRSIHSHSTEGGASADSPDVTIDRYAETVRLDEYRMICRPQESHELRLIRT